MKPTLVRTAVSGGALALTLGVAAPALACVSWDEPGALPGATFTSTDPGKHSKADDLTLAELKAKVDARLVTKVERLEKARDRVADSTTRSDDEKADTLARIDARIAKLQAAREAVAAATTTAEVKAALKAAFTPSVDEVKAAIDAKITRLLGWIDDKQAALEADTSIDPDVLAAKLARLQAWEDKLLALQATIADDTTLEEIKADLKAAGVGRLFGHHVFGHHGWGWFGDRHGKGHHHHAKGDRGKGSSDKADPGRWDRGSGSTRTVSVSFQRDRGDRGGYGHHGGGHGSGHHGAHGGHGGHR